MDYITHDVSINSTNITPTIYWQKYWDTPPNHWIQLFQ